MSDVNVTILAMQVKPNGPLTRFQNLSLIKDFFFFLSLGYSYERLDGSVRGEERNLAVKNFSSQDIFVFLLSTKAGKWNRESNDTNTEVKTFRVLI